MAKIINGKKYDPETAKYCGEKDNGLYPSDFNYVCETLYRKKTGEFFLYCEGGANTKFAKRCGSNSWTGGDVYIPMSYDEAKDWAETSLEAKEYEATFNPCEDEEAVLSIRISAKLKAKITQLADAQSKTYAEVIADLIEKA